MKNTLDWFNFKNFIVNNSLVILYKSVIYYSTNDPIVDDICSYNLETVYNGKIFYCVIIKENPRSVDEIDFEDNYQDSSIELL